jgi:hypothetical protein
MRLTIHYFQMLCVVGVVGAGVLAEERDTEGNDTVRLPVPWLVKCAKPRACAYTAFIHSSRRLVGNESKGGSTFTVECRGDDDGRSLSDRLELGGMEVKGPISQIAEVRADTTDSGCRWCLRAPPRPVMLFLRFQRFEGEGTSCVAGGIALGGGR